MDFYNSVIQNSGKSDLIDLSTGDPFIFPFITSSIKEHLSRIQNDNSHLKIISSYCYYDGLPELKQNICDLFSEKLNRRLDIGEVLITPGVQNTLRYIHNISNQRNKKILIPFHLEFPGAYPLNIEMLSNMKMDFKLKQWESINSVSKFSEISNLEWQEIGFAIISNPHNPTSIYFDDSLIEYLHNNLVQNNSYLVIDHTYDFPFASITNKDYAHSIYGLPNIINLYSFSKIGLASERIGIVIADKIVINEIRNQLIRNIIQTPKIGQLLCIGLMNDFKKNKNFQTEIREWYNSQWEMANSFIQNSNPKYETNLVKREGGTFISIEFDKNIDVEILKRKCYERGFAFTTYFDLMPEMISIPKKANGVRLGLGKGKEVLMIGLQILFEELNKI